jgi:hypothetical protein
VRWRWNSLHTNRETADYTEVYVHCDSEAIDNYVRSG